MVVSNSRIISFYLIGIFGRLPFLLQDCLSFGSADFTASAALQGICGSTRRFIPLIKRGCIPCALHMRQTRRLQNSGNTSHLLLIHPLLQRFATLKKREFLRSYFCSFTGFWIPAGISIVLLYIKRAKPADFDTAAFCKGIGHFSKE